MSQASQRDFAWKIIVGGQGGVGKTSILYRFVHNQFLESTKLTIGVEFHTQALERQGHNISLVLWDLGGQEQFKKFHDAYIKGAHGGIVCFDLNRRATLEQAREWIEMFKGNCPSMPILLVGTKYDLIADYPRVVEEAIEDSTDLVKKYDLLGMMFTSAKTGGNVNESIYFLIDVILANINDPIQCTILE